MTRRGLTLIEAMLSLAITATLLAALAGAFAASADAVRSNDAYFRSTQTGRLALGQMLTEIRRADAAEVDPSGMQLRIIRPAGQRTADEIDRRYTFEPTLRRITLQIETGGQTSTEAYELATDVTACRFETAVRLSADDSHPFNPPCISITLSCSAGETSVTLAGSATPRRSMK